MRKLKLLFAACALLFGGVGLPQAWAAQIPTADTFYYLYNPTTGLFLSRGSSYSTAASADEFGLPIKLEANSDAYRIQYIDDTSHYVGSAYWSYTDQAEANWQSYTLSEQDAIEHTYKLICTTHGASNLTLYINASNAVGNPSLAKQVASNGNTTDCAEGWDVWQFLTQAEHDAIVSAYTASNEADIASSASITLGTSSLEDIILDESVYAAKDLSSSISSLLTSGNYSKINEGGNAKEQTAGGIEVYEGAGTFTQTITGLTNGIYKVTVNGFFRDGSNANCYNYKQSGWTVSNAYLEANGNKAMLADWASGATDNSTPNSPAAAQTLFGQGKYLTTVYAYVSDGNLTVNLRQPHNVIGSRWLYVANATLTYYSDAVSDEDASAILSTATSLVSETMNADILSTLSSAKTTFESSKTISNYNTLSAAVSAAQASVAAYAGTKAYLDRINGYLTGENTFTNFYTTAAYNTYYADIKAKYDARTLTTEEGATLNADVAYQSGTTWHALNNLDNLMLSVWNQDGTQSNEFDTKLHLNTWSIEGNTDGSEFYAPFYEYWVESKEVLAASTMTATITGLKANETYSVTLRARVQPTDNKTMIDDAITMKVGSGEAVCISAGAKFGSTNYYIGNFSAVGKTDADGNLVTTITVADASNVSWLAFYNVRYTEGEDLSAYIADYEFALNTATTNAASATYANVTGKEKSDLNTAITTYTSVDKTNKAALITAKEALETANGTFVAAAATYNTFAELNTTVAAKLGVTLPAITAATVAADLDVESYIVDEYTAGKAYTQDYTSKLGSWTNAPGTNKGESWNGTDDDTYYDLYNNGEIKAMTQTVTLPAGDYALIAKGRASVDGLLTVSDGTNTVTFPHKSSTGRGIATDGTATFADGATYANSNNGRGWEYRVLTFTSDGEAATTLTFNMTTASWNWVGLDDIELLCNPAALDYSALQTAYNAITVPTLGFEEGEYAPYTNAENLAAIATAKGYIDNQDANSQTEINNITTAISSLAWTVNAAQMNAVYNGDFSKSTANATSGVDVNMPGWTMVDGIRLVINNTTDYPGLTSTSGSAGVFSWGGTALTYGEKAGYTMPLAAHTIYELTAKISGWKDGDLPSWLSASVLKETEGMASMNILSTSVTKRISDDDPFVTCTVKFVTGEAGNYVLSLNPNQHNVLTDISITKAANQYLEFADGAALPTYAPGTYPTVKITRTLTAGKWATGVYPFAVSWGSHVAVLDSYDKVTGALGFKTGVPSPNEPFLMRPDHNASELILSNVVVSAIAANPTVTKNEASLKGVYAATTVDNSAKNYVLSNNVIYPIGANSATVNPYRAYIQIAQDADPARGLTFTVDGETTAIDGITAGENAEDGAVYNLQGQRVVKAQKGLYIKDGRKVMVK